jgi:hypothetical protein
MTKKTTISKQAGKTKHALDLFRSDSTRFKILVPDSVRTIRAWDLGFDGPISYVQLGRVLISAHSISVQKTAIDGVVL